MSPQSSRVMSPDAAGPSSSPPVLPEGWLAQWDGRQQRWYYVQPVTRKSQWEIPTEPFIASTSSTPHSAASPGPYPSPLTMSSTSPESEATRELMEVRNAKWGGNGNFAATQQLSPQSTSPRSQRTPVAGDGVPHPRSSAQSTPVHAISDISTLANQDEMMVQHNSPNHSRVGSNTPQQPISMAGQVQGFHTTSGSPANQHQQQHFPPHPQPFNETPMQNSSVPMGQPPHGDSMEVRCMTLTLAPSLALHKPAADPRYTNQPIPSNTPESSLPRVSPVQTPTTPKNMEITLPKMKIPNAPPVFPLSHREAQRKRQSERQESYAKYREPESLPRNMPPPPPGFGSNPIYDPLIDQGRPVYQDSIQGPPVGSYGAPRQHGSPGNGPSWQHQPPPPQQQQQYGGYQSGMPPRADYVPPPQQQHYGDVGGYSGNWGR
ncbi:hypothetical protein MGYG_09030 [Nannizzia gypsea CBS 118893]|uniref:WW domain-containing protein n=1 Tax=Arthroderma gypseum (strain ATCC MYA-4604 / CBS 118893) TaxID=535722 RepID=E4UU43_ARTGP|nr:hypothetical protein MGYG_09030 [Nannizzia gypsea CBS 118893]EFR00810.1 hypothetical protein MGYG_09030 [Nannizzia gypsea CBS 118893]